MINVGSGHRLQIGDTVSFSVLFPAHQLRDYDTAGRPVTIDHVEQNQIYANPLIWPQRDWRDQFIYGAEGQIIGWIRKPRRGQARHFTGHGLEVLETGEAGRAALAQQVHYRLVSDGAARQKVVETPSGQLFQYRYGGAEDQLGTPVPVSGGG